MANPWRMSPLILLMAVAACRQPEVRTRFLRSETYEFSRTERATIDRVANATAAEVRRLLPGLPAQLEVTARPGTDVIGEIGADAAAMPPNAVMWTVNPAHGAGVGAIAERELRATLFHEFHHLVRSNAEGPRSDLDRAVLEGMATAFERDFAGATRPWGEHPPEGSGWEAELLAHATKSSTTAEGRRWFLYRTGTAWVDRATAKSGRTSADLVSTPAAEVLKLAGVAP